MATANATGRPPIAVFLVRCTPFYVLYSLHLSLPPFFLPRRIVSTRAFLPLARLRYYFAYFVINFIRSRRICRK